MGVYTIEGLNLESKYDSEGQIINCLYKDSNNNIWLGYEGRGLGRLTISPFENISISSGIFQGYPMAFLEDDDGRIWVGTLGHGVYRFNDRNDQKPYNLKDFAGDSGNSVRSLAQTKDGSIWIGSFNGIVRYKNGKIDHYTTDDGLSHIVIRNLYVDDEGVLWISTDNGITLYKDKKFAPFKYNNKFIHRMIRQIEKDDKGVYWIATLGGLYYYYDNELKLYSNERKTPVISIETLMIDSNGNLWLGGIDGLLIKIEKDGTPKRIGQEHGFQVSTIYFLLEDDIGQIWVGTGIGVQCIEPGGSIYLYNQENGLVGNECNSRACM